MEQSRVALHPTVALLCEVKASWSDRWVAVLL